MDTNWPAFLAVLAVAYAVPGPDFAVILRASTRHSRAGVAAAVGAQCGLCVHMLFAVAGLSVLLAQHPSALTAVRIVGGVYLLYLGGRLIAGTVAHAGADHPARQTADVAGAFAQGFLTNVTNPKAVLFFASVLPQFLTAGPVALPVQVLVLGLVDVLAGALPWAVVIVVGSRLSSLLDRRHVRDWWDRVTGTLLGGLGGTLLVKGA